jgi:hypothetical protein
MQGQQQPSPTIIVLGLEALTAFPLGLLFSERRQFAAQVSRDGTDSGWPFSCCELIVVQAAVHFDSIFQERWRNAVLGQTEGPEKNLYRKSNAMLKRPGWLRISNPMRPCAFGRQTSVAPNSMDRRQQSAHGSELEEDCVRGAEAGAASLIKIGHRGNAKFPATSSITFTWQT